MKPEQIDQARRFLAKAVPWPENGDGYINIHWAEHKPDPKKSDKEKLFWSGRACRTLDQAASTLAWLDGLNGRREVYVCMSSQVMAEEKTSRKGKKYLAAVRSGKHAKGLKSLFIDVDFKGGDHGYDSQEEAVHAIASFLKTVGLPKPSVMVLSGGGVHLHFTLSRALDREEWQQFAHALAEAGKQNGLKADWQCTVDAARILRVPGTFNNKLDTPRPVTLASNPLDFDYDPERLWKVLAPYKVAVAAPNTPPMLTFEQAPATAPTMPLTDDVNNELSAGIELQRAPVHLDDLAKECAFIEEAIRTGGAAYTNPMWNLTTLIATFTDDARFDAHRMGCKHPEYDREKTDEFFYRKQREREEKGLGFPTCVSISGTGCTACKTCQHFSNGRSPLYATRQTVPAVSAVAVGQVPALAGPVAQPGDLPDGYVRDPLGYICHVEYDKEGQQDLVPICAYQMVDPWLQLEPRMLHFTANVDMHTKENISIDCEVINTMEMRRVLQGQGLMLPVGDKAMQRVGGFLVSWIRKLQQTRDSIKSAPFGWTVEKGKVNGFVYAGTVWMTNGTRQSASPDPVIQRQYKPTGDLQPWLDAAELVTSQGRHDLAALLASSFAAPLVRFTGHAGVLMSAYSTESGVGKTTCLKVAQAIWGDPVTATQSLDDTQNSVMNKLGTLRSLPLYWDELKTETDTRKFVNITFQTTQGKEKSRMTRNVTQREPGRWQTLLVSASNDSLLDFVLQSTSTTTAGLYRIFEYVVQPAGPNVPKRDSSSVQLMIAKLNDNYGNAGLEYAKFLGSNYATIETEMAETLKGLEEELSINPDERFWLALVATLIMGAKYANQIGLTKFDLDGLKEFLVAQLTRMRLTRDAQPVDMGQTVNLTSLLQRFLSAHQAKHTIVTNRIHVSRGKPARGAITVLNDMTKHDGIYVHIGHDDKLLRISSTRLTYWLREAGHPRNAFVSMLQRELGVRDVSGRLGSGTQYAQMTERLLEIDLAGKPELDFIDEQ